MTTRETLTAEQLDEQAELCRKMGEDIAEGWLRQAARDRRTIEGLREWLVRAVLLPDDQEAAKFDAALLLQDVIAKLAALEAADATGEEPTS